MAEKKVLADRKLGFVEVGRGKLGIEMQRAFEQAAISARDLNGKVSVKLTVNLYPPDPGEHAFGAVDYSIRVVEPAAESAKYTTLLRDGVPINEGSDQAAALQYEMSLSMPGQE